MIRKISLGNFKSLADFKLDDIGSFTCLIGLNGSGKSTLLQGFDFLGQLMHGRMKDWMGERGWENAALKSKLQNKSFIPFQVIVSIESLGHVIWTGIYSPTKYSCVYETVSSTAINGQEFVFDKDRVEINGQSQPLSFEFEGSILSQLKLSPDTHPELFKLREYIRSLKSLELLSPHLMRSASRNKTGDIGLSGENLPVFLSSLNTEQQKKLRDELVNFYPHLADWNIKSQKYGWKSLLIREGYGNGIVTDSRHVNDGFLRIIAILAQSLSSHQVLLYDEIENGINPEIIEKLVDYLVGCGKQVIVTTHSPMILNYLTDSVARESVVLLYKTIDGKTHAAKYFDCPKVAEKLDCCGPGEVYVDTPISEVVDYFIAQEKK